MIKSLWIRKRFARCFLRLKIILPVMFGVLLLQSTGYAGDVLQKGFASPEDAAAALVEALKNNDRSELLAVFAPDGESILDSGDEIQDRVHRERFVRSFKEKCLFEKEAEKKVILCVGKIEWPFPIPIVKKDERWYFDTKVGKEEILNRRIGRNELKVMEILQVYTDAQREYVSKDRDGDGVLEYARKIASEKGQRDGLYWKVEEGKEESPFGPLVAAAAEKGYRVKEGTRGGSPTPYYGYFYKILEGQGPNAKGGAYGYVAKENMILGFGMLAYPAEYGTSGIISFMINQEGVIHEKDLGENTSKIVEAIKLYDPDESWKRPDST